MLGQGSGAPPAALVGALPLIVQQGDQINTEYSLEGLLLNLNLQYFGHLMQRADCLKKILILGKTEGKRRRAGRGYGYEIEQTPGDSAEKEMATHSSVLAWRIPGTWGSLVGCCLWGHTESDMTEAT